VSKDKPSDDDELARLVNQAIAATRQTGTFRVKQLLEEADRTEPAPQRARQIEAEYQHRRAQFLQKFIEILDNFDRALEAAGRTQATTGLVEGMILVRSQVLATLRDEGLERVPVLGLPFDPAVTEALEVEDVQDPGKDGIVLADLRRAYRLDGRLVRPGQVRVARYRPPASEPEQTWRSG
jgi:molecular chaperone GrpE